MEYFLGHIIYIIIGGLIVAAICAVWAFAAAKWDKTKKEEGFQDAIDCGMGCSGCAMFAACGKKREE